MVYLLSDGATTVVTYPYDQRTLQSDNPNVSFPPSASASVLADFYVYPVELVSKPEHDEIYENVVELQPEAIAQEGTGYLWVQRWEVQPASNEEIAQRFAKLEETAAARAAELIHETDAYVAASVAQGLELHPDLLAYRAAVADYKNIVGYPMSFSWPTKPSNIYDGNADFADFFDTLLTDSVA